MKKREEKITGGKIKTRKQKKEKNKKHILGVFYRPPKLNEESDNRLHAEI